MKTIADQQIHLPSHAPIMVLPGAQLFPHAPLPLFIFEPRYREMLAWCLEEERMFCIAPLKPGRSAAHSTDDFRHVVGLGLVRACVGRDDGTSHLILQGLARVRLTGFVQEAPFRIATLEELPSISAPAGENESLTTKLLAVCGLLRSAGVPLSEALDQRLAETNDPAILSDIIAHSFLSDPEQRQEVFETLEVSARSRLLIHYLLAGLAGAAGGDGAS